MLQNHLGEVGTAEKNFEDFTKLNFDTAQTISADCLKFFRKFSKIISQKSQPHSRIAILNPPQYQMEKS